MTASLGRSGVSTAADYVHLLSKASVSTPITCVKGFEAPISVSHGEKVVPRTEACLYTLQRASSLHELRLAMVVKCSN